MRPTLHNPEVSRPFTLGSWEHRGEAQTLTSMTTLHAAAYASRRDRDADHLLGLRSAPRGPAPRTRHISRSCSHPAVYLAGGACGEDQTIRLTNPRRLVLVHPSKFARNVEVSFRALTTDWLDDAVRGRQYPMLTEGDRGRFLCFECYPRLSCGKTTTWQCLGSPGSSNWSDPNSYDTPAGAVAPKANLEKQRHRTASRICNATPGFSATGAHDFGVIRKVPRPLRERLFRPLSPEAAAREPEGESIQIE